MYDKILGVILKSIQNVLRNKIMLMKALLLPVLVTSSFIIFQSDQPSFTYTIFNILAQWVIYTMLAVTTHRIILLGSNSVTEWGLYLPGHRELTFFYHSFLIALIMIPIGLASFIPGIGIYITMILAAYIIGRVSLVFPSIATDDALTLSDSWGSTQDYKMMMFVVVFVFPFVVTIPQYAIAEIPNIHYALVINNLFSLITLVFVVAALSESYRVIEGQFIES